MSLTSSMIYSLSVQSRRAASASGRGATGACSRDVLSFAHDLISRMEGSREMPTLAGCASETSQSFDVRAINIRFVLNRASWKIPIRLYATQQLDHPILWLLEVLCLDEPNSRCTNRPVCQALLLEDLCRGLHVFPQLACSSHGHLDCDFAC